VCFRPPRDLDAGGTLSAFVAHQHNSVFALRRDLLFCLIVFFCYHKPTYAQCSQSSWTVDLASGYGFHQFGPPTLNRHQRPDRWKTQQGLVSLSPDILAVYQVIETAQLQAAQPRDASGGGGRYTLKIVFLSVSQNGKELRTLSLITDGNTSSELFSTGDGDLIVQTGKLLRQFSDSLTQDGSLALPVTGETINEQWILARAESDGTILARHDQDTGWHGKYSYELFEIDTRNLGLRKYEGLPDEANDTVNFPSSVWKKQLPRSLLKRNEFFYSATRSSHYIAAEVRRDHGEKPGDIIVYDVTRAIAVCSVRSAQMAYPRMMLYAVSSDGALATIQNNKLSVWK
jgi:hypothetical protein